MKCKRERKYQKLTTGSSRALAPGMASNEGIGGSFSMIWNFLLFDTRGFSF
jgi:hypothetical protein